MVAGRSSSNDRCRSRPVCRSSRVAAGRRASGGCASDSEEDALEERVSLAEQRVGAVTAALRAAGARSVLDVGCGAGRLLRALMKDGAFERITGVDVSMGALAAAARRLHLDTMSPR